MANPAQIETRTAYLTVDGASVYEVTPNTSVTIGRLDSNDIVLDDYKVSREHAVLKYAQGEFVLVDLASTHGTFFRGHRIERAVIQVGEIFNIVGHELTLRWEMPKSGAGEAAIQLHRGRSLDRRLKFFGGLNEFSLITLVQFLYQEKQSGLLILEHGQHAGPRIYFQAGEITHVVEAEAPESESLSELLTRTNHETSLFFYFHHETEFPNRTVFQSTPNYLMELCHEQDVKRSEAAGALASHARGGSKATTAMIEVAPLPVAPPPPPMTLPPLPPM